MNYLNRIQVEPSNMTQAIMISLEHIHLQSSFSLLVDIDAYFLIHWFPVTLFNLRVQS
jgi:hypothetical protein